MPNFEEYGFTKSKIVYQQTLYESSVQFNDPITLTSLQKIVKDIRSTEPENSFIQLDIETWLGPGPVAPRNILDRYRDTLVEFKKNAGKEYKVGYYRIAPAWAHWDLPQNKARHAIWLRENTRRQDIADAADVLYPALYTYTDNIDNWLAVAELVMSVSRKMAKGKPVIPFIWPRFHGTSGLEGVGDRYMPRAYWRKQLEFLKQHADGMIIWNDGLYTQWDENAPWWVETKLFLETQKQ